MVKDLNRQGMSVLYTTHYMEEAQELSDRVGIIDHGRLIALGTQAELTRQVGEQQTLRLHVAEDQNAEALATAVRALPGVVSASATDHTVALITPSAAAVLGPVVGQANLGGFRLRSVDIEEPNLEAVFLQLTGRALRD
jgi:ABC-2 type transport system ATP-binding protein